MLEFMVGIMTKIYWFVVRCLNTSMFGLVSCAAITIRDLSFFVAKCPNQPHLDVLPVFRYMYLKLVCYIRS
jgi:hypothetical protein